MSEISILRVNSLSSLVLRVDKRDVMLAAGNSYNKGKSLDLTHLCTFTMQRSATSFITKQWINALYLRMFCKES
jgi:hypothetical protein